MPPLLVLWRRAHRSGSIVPGILSGATAPGVQAQESAGG
jgi:hypothetical protein